MYCSRKTNNLINNIHRRALRIAYNDHTSTFEKLPQKDNTVTIHNRNLERLATEIYKTINHMNPTFMDEIFQVTETPYNLRSTSFKQKKPNTVIYGLDAISYRCNHLWNSIRLKIRTADNLGIFKTKIKQIDLACNCKLCTPYVQNIGYIK